MSGEKRLYFGIPKYLKKIGGESRCRRMAKIKLGNEIRKRKYCEENEKSIECAQEKKRHVSMFGRGVSSGRREKVDGKKQ